MKFLLPDVYCCLIQRDCTARNYHNSIRISAVPSTIPSIPVSAFKSVRIDFNCYFSLYCYRRGKSF